MTVHTYYWDDDQPMMYFGDGRGRPAYCASHVVPLESLPSDLASAATTPNFAWVSPDGTQRSLAIITFDEDAQDCH